MSVTVAQTVEFLRARAARARAERRAREARVRERAREILADVLPEGSRAWLIGSLAWGGFGPGSDVDVVLSGVPEPGITDLEIRLARELEVEVDVLRWEALPASFRERVGREGIAIHATRS